MSGDVSQLRCSGCWRCTNGLDAEGDGGIGTDWADNESDHHDDVGCNKAPAKLTVLSALKAGDMVGALHDLQAAAVYADASTC